MYCIECGKEEKLYENLCKNCFLNLKTFFKVPKVIKLTLCTLCNARLKGKHWEEVSSDDEGIEKTVKENIWTKPGIQIQKISMKLDQTKTNIVKAKIDIDAQCDDLNIKKKLESEIKINYITCSRCSRISGSYFEAIIQVRATNRNLDDEEIIRTEEIVHSSFLNSDRGSENAFLTKIEYLHGGVDFYLGSSKFARQITKKFITEFAGKSKESSTLVGRKDGRDMYRSTFIVRIPDYRMGDFIKIDDAVFMVFKLQPKYTICIDLKLNKKVKFDQSILQRAITIGGKELAFDAVVVLETKTEVTVLDPETYQTLELLKPMGYEIEGDTVKIFKYGELTYLIPNLK